MLCTIRLFTFTILLGLVVDETVHPRPRPHPLLLHSLLPRNYLPRIPHPLRYRHRLRYQPQLPHPSVRPHPRSLPQRTESRVCLAPKTPELLFWAPRYPCSSSEPLHAGRDQGNSELRWKLSNGVAYQRLV
ncbi:hypothetical protein B0H13DRAFT_89234 [Mycena leptocephala]|nr:hypothetical protein B0H13DRAFT_89234 [Mycena leptocephala]